MIENCPWYVIGLAGFALGAFPDRATMFLSRYRRKSGENDD